MIARLLLIAITRSLTIDFVCKMIVRLLLIAITRSLTMTLFADPTPRTIVGSWDM